MIRNHRVIAFTPYGREKTVSILAAYLKREHDRGLLDEWWLCENTDPKQESDRAYGKQLAAEHDWIHLVERDPAWPDLKPKQRRTGLFYQLMQDPDTVYVRFDDDIVYLHEGALETLVSTRLDMHGSVFAAFPIIINNAIVSWHLQNQKRIPGPSKGWESVQFPYCMDAVGWGSGEFAVKLHELTLAKIEAGQIEDLFLHHTVMLPPRQQFSVSCFAVTGDEYLKGPGDMEEEFWHSVHQPAAVGKVNIIVDRALVVHYSFLGQHEELNATDLLNRYRGLAAKL